MTLQDGVALLQRAFWHQAERLLYNHTNPWELDEALCAWGCTLGPCEAQDLMGLDKVLEAHGPWPGPILPRMVAEGRLGKVGGVGYYRYPGGGGAVIDPLIEDLILEEAWFGKVDREDLSDADIVSRMTEALRQPIAEIRARGADDGSVRNLLRDALHISSEVSLEI